MIETLKLLLRESCGWMSITILLDLKHTTTFSSLNYFGIQY